MRTHYNGLRLAGALVRESENEVRVFLIGDAALAGHRRQKTPSGHYNIETMVSHLVKHGGGVGVCGSCLDARGILEEELIPGTHRSSMEEPVRWTAWADKAMVF